MNFYGCLSLTMALGAMFSGPSVLATETVEETEKISLSEQTREEVARKAETEDDSSVQVCSMYRKLLTSQHKSLADGCREIYDLLDAHLASDIHETALTECGLCQSACNDEKDGAGCYHAAQMLDRQKKYSQRDEISPEVLSLLEKSKEYLNRECDAGNSASCFYLGQAYEFEFARYRDKAEARLRNLVRDAKDNQARGVAYYNLGRYYTLHNRTDLDFSQYARACKLDNADACRHLSLNPRRVSEDADGPGSPSASFVKYSSYLREACEDLDDGYACFHLGEVTRMKQQQKDKQSRPSFSLEAQASLREHNKAIGYFAKACRAGLGSACYNAGVYFRYLVIGLK
ncbi:MAG: sel1 repeat family protein [Succinivibrionaceae bacterium]|nr:sel1 repeat family protein [Succinivibrionaceae bacterium]